MHIICHCKGETAPGSAGLGASCEQRVVWAVRLFPGVGLSGAGGKTRFSNAPSATWTGCLVILGPLVTRMEGGHQPPLDCVLCVLCSFIPRWGVSPATWHPPSSPQGAQKQMCPLMLILALEDRLSSQRPTMSPVSLSFMKGHEMLFHLCSLHVNPKASSSDSGLSHQLGNEAWGKTRPYHCLSKRSDS